jgi:hypothetical protein
MNLKLKMNWLAPAAVAAAALGWLSISSSGCELIASVDRTLISPGGGGGTPTGVGGNEGGGGNNTGGGGTMCVAEMCPGEDTTCAVRACDDGGECVFENSLPGTHCPEFMGEGGGGPDEGVCDGMGTCVECTTATEDSQCSGTDKCIGNECVPATCTDGVVDYAAGETGSNGTNLECGGPCPACINGQGCNDRDDCAGLLCDTAGGGPGGAGGGSPMGTCIACTGDTVTSDCDTDLFCDGTNACVLDLAAGTACTGDDQCNGTGTAVCAQADGDNVCCDTECAGTCESCLAANTDDVDGVCAPNTVDTDPDTDCDTTGLANACNTGNCIGTAAACKPLPNLTVCDTDSGECDVADTCNGTSLSCTDTFEPATTFCGAGITEPICQPNDKCNGTGTCINGAAAGNGVNCQDALFCDGVETCQGGTCTAPAIPPCPGPDGDTDCVESMCDEGTDTCAYDGDGAACMGGVCCDNDGTPGCEATCM